MFSHIDNEDVEEYILVSTNIYNTFTYRFNKKEDFDSWGDGFLDPISPWPREASSGIIWESIKWAAGNSTFGDYNSWDLRDQLDDLLKKEEIELLDEKLSLDIVIGSFENEKNAQEFAKDNNAKIVQHTMTDDEGKKQSLFRVVKHSGEFSNFVDVLDKRNELRSEGYEDAWINIRTKDE